ncbi:hypothetical protein ACN47E_000769 [Coniothyrium glycines]
MARVQRAASAEAAAHQLLDEAGAARSLVPTRTHMQPAAVLGANLLNAARVDHARSSPTDMAHQTRPGKLKSVPSTSIVRHARQNLARRGDQYDIELSPVKGELAVPGKASAKSSQIVVNFTKDSTTLGSGSGESSKLARHLSDPDFEPQLPLSSPKYNAQPERKLATVEHDCDGTTAADIPRASRTVKRSSPRVQIPVRGRQTHTSSRQGGARPSHDAGKYTDLRLLRSSKRRLSNDLVSADVVGTGVQTLSKKHKNSTKGTLVNKNVLGMELESSDRGISSNDDSDSDVIGIGSVPRQEERDTAKEILECDHRRDIDLVFEAARSLRRSGECQSTMGLEIRHKCKHARTFLRNEIISPEQLAEKTDMVCKQLQSLNDIVAIDERGPLKADVYCFVFREVVMYAEQMQKWLEHDSKPNTTTSVGPGLLYRLVGEIIAATDRTSNWKATVPSRFKGEAIISDVRTKIIKPLRDLYESTRRKPTQVRDIKNNHKTLAYRQKESKIRAEEERESAMKATAGKELWKRWQGLHILRMECEPSLSRRKRLSITDFRGVDETDANGEKIVRVQLFKRRSADPSNWFSALVESQHWTDEAEQALLEGLQLFSGPCVFEKIFRQYCGGSGLLRDYTVTDIVLKTAWICSKCIELHLEEDWQIPRWIIDLPSIP